MNNKLNNLLSIDDIDFDCMNEILEIASYHKAHGIPHNELKGAVIVNAFFESSTRTLSSFEIAAKKLGAHVINMSEQNSAIQKGESLVDTAKTINSWAPSAVVMRHRESGAAHMLSEYLDCSLVNGGDGCCEHPTQALLDIFTLQNHVQNLKGFTLGICGDVLHSRVAKSNIELLRRFDVNIKIISPPQLELYHLCKEYSIECFYNISSIINDLDGIMMLRLQKERVKSSLISSHSEYFRFYGLNDDKLNNLTNKIIVMHPGPVNRNIEISSNLMEEGHRNMHNLIPEQVTNGVYIRSAVLWYLIMQ